MRYGLNSMKKKSLLFVILWILILCSGAFAGCARSVNDNALSLTKTEYAFQNYSSEFTLPASKMQAYFYANGNVPYMDILDFVSALDGFLDTENFSASVNEKYNVLTLSWLYEGIYKLYCSVNWETNEIYVNDLTFFYNTVPYGETNYAYALQTTDYYSSGGSSVTFHLQNYGFDILYYYGKCLIPFCVLNTLFCSYNMYNVYFNGDAFYGIYFLPSDLDSETYTAIKTSSLNGTDCPSDVRTAAVNHLCFVMDHFYGLKEYKNISSFRAQLSADVLADLMSVDPDDNIAAYAQIFHKGLDEMHTSLTTLSYYNEPDAWLNVLSPDVIGDHWLNFYSVYTELYLARESRWEDSAPPVVRFSDDTAIITLDQFVTGTQEQIYNGNAIRDDAWQYDSFFYMRKAMEDIASHGGINNIVLDITFNGGGNLGAMERVLGYLTDSALPISVGDTLSGAASVEYVAVDTDLDEDFTDKDSFDTYEWFVMTSPYTFSAANTFASVCQSTGIATIIGEQSGGGMCSVMPVILADGTALQMSSNTCMQSVSVQNGNTAFHDIEGGITPDRVLERSYFYTDDAYLDSFVSNL